MVRAFFVPSLLSGIVLIFWLWALIDAILTDSMLVRHLQKSTWIFLIIFVPTFGAALWVFFGRPEGASVTPGGAMTYENNPYRSEGRALGVEDTPGWTAPSAKPSPPPSTTDAEALAIRERKLMEYEAELAKREEALAAREESADDGDADTERSTGDDHD